MVGFATHSGEFTLRAFLNGRLDLSQAENVEKLISAKSSAAADAALEGIQVYILLSFVSNRKITFSNFKFFSTLFFREGFHLW